MSKLFRQRLTKHLSEMARYLRYVFNDHFVIALMFMVGGLGFGYSNGLKGLETGIWWAPYVVIFTLLLLLQLGRLATLMNDADVVFLLPRERSMHAYFINAKNYSEIMAMLIQIVGWFVLIPFIRVTDDVSWLFLFELLVTQLILKDAFLERELVLRYQYRIKLIQSSILFKWLLPVIVIGVSYLVNPVFGLVLAIILNIGIRYISFNRWQKVQIDWNKAIMMENNRMLGIYRFFNLFTNVPSITGSVKRRRYLDFIVNRIKPTRENTYLYLFSRSILRGTEFGSLYLRLTLLGMVLLVFIQQQWLIVVLTILFIYLIGFQLIPSYFHFDDIVFTHLYPINEKQKLDNFSRTTAIALSITAVLLAGTTLIAQQDWKTALISLVLEGIEILLLVKFYIPGRLLPNKSSN